MRRLRGEIPDGADNLNIELEKSFKKLIKTITTTLSLLPSDLPLKTELEQVLAKVEAFLEEEEDANGVEEAA